jgi:hypothetical protein
MMPQLVTVRVHDGQRRPIRLWVPLLPVIIVLSPLLLVAVLVAVVGCLIYRIHPLRALRATWSVLSALRGVRLDIHQGRTTVYVNIA